MSEEVSKQAEVKTRLKAALFGGNASTNGPSDSNSSDSAAPQAEVVSGDAPASPGVADEATDNGPGESPQAQQDDSQPASQEPMHTVVINGKSESVPLSKLIANYQIGENIGEKSREVASKEKAIEATKTEVLNLQNQYAERLTMLEAALKPQLPTPQAMNAALQAGDTARYLQMQNQVMQYNAVMAEKQQLEAQKQQQQTEQLKARMAKENELLVAQLPEYKEQAAHQKLRGYLQKSSITDAEIGTILDHRLIVIADKAMRWDELQAKTPTTQQKIEATPRIKTPQARQNDGDVDSQRGSQALKAFKEVGSVKNMSSADRKSLQKRLGIN